MKILFLGDIFGRPGRDGVTCVLPELKKKYSPDVIGANVENLAHGRGITNESINDIMNGGVDFFTSGNHVWEGGDSKELLLKEGLPLVRPANYPPGAYGKGFCIVNVGTRKLLVINLMGRVFMRVQIDCPFRKADEILLRYGITDVALESSIGLDKHAMMREMVTQVPQKKEVAEGRVEIGGVLFDIGKEGKCRKVTRIREF